VIKGYGKAIYVKNSSRFYTFLKIINGKCVDAFFDANKTGKNFFKENPNEKKEHYRIVAGKRLRRLK
jgi:hypothetical protein